MAWIYQSFYGIIYLKYAAEKQCYMTLSCLNSHLFEQLQAIFKTH